MPLSPSQPQEELHPKGKEIGILVLDAFAKLQIATQLRIFLAVRVEQLGCHWTGFYELNITLPTNALIVSFILNNFFKTLFTAPTCFDSISLTIIREHIIVPS